MNEEALDKLCDELTPLYFYFHLLNAVENTTDVKDKIRHLEMVRLMKNRCDKSLINIREILHGNV